MRRKQQKPARLDWVAVPKEGETVTTADGGKHSFTRARYDAIPMQALRVLAECVGFGLRKYGQDNWKRIPIEEHMGHAMGHLVQWQCGDRSEPHLVNAAARVMFALQLAIESEEQGEQYEHPDEA